MGWGKGGQKPESMFTSVRSVRVDQCLSEGKLSRARASPRRSLQCRAAKKRRDQHEQHHAATSGAVKFLSRRETLGVGLATYLLADGVNVARAEEEVQAFIPVEKLSRPARQEQIAALRKTINKAIIEHVKSDYRNSLELAFLDCITHNKMSKAGGSNGSIRIREELDSLGLKYLEKTIDEIGKAKAAAEKNYPVPIDISWADMIAITGYRKTLGHFREVVAARAKDQNSANVILVAYGNDLPKPKLGRVDATSPDIVGGSLDLRPAELVMRAKEAGLTAQQIAALADAFPRKGDTTLDDIEKQISAEDPKIANYITNFDRSRKELTQTSYQIDVGNAYYKLTSLGATFDLDRYLVPIPRPKPRY